MQKITVKVPATSANLGSGFDAVGMALKLYNIIEFERAEELVITGCPKEYQNSDNLAYVGYSAVAERLSQPFGVKISFLSCDIPPSRGLGSSSSLLVAGAYAANRLFGEGLSEEELSSLVTELEGHPDNVIPAFFGGLCASLISQEGSVMLSKFPVSDKLFFTLMIPSFEGKTSDARAVLPSEVKRADAVFNISRAALLPTAFEKGDFELIKFVTEDAIHQKYRKAIYHNFDEAEGLARECGAVSVTVSGAGPTALVISSEDISERLAEKLLPLESSWRVLSVKPDISGVREI